MNYWLHRISHIAELSYPLLDKVFLTIGFSDFTHQEFIDKVLQDDWNYFNVQFQEMWGKVSRTTTFGDFSNSIREILSLFQVGEPFFVCEIKDGLEFSKMLLNAGINLLNTNL
ncbi:MAG: hypothetical protein ACP5DZ_05585 [Bacteroidales bacterium]